ncbi:hypothetical protein [Leptolyngbya phage Lbo-JY46]
MYVPYGIDFRTMDEITKKKRRKVKKLLSKIRKYLKKKTLYY